MTVLMKNEHDISTEVYNALMKNLNSLVGRNILIQSEQFQGQPIKSKVVLVNNKTISVDRSGGQGMIEELLNNQDVIVQFEYKSQRISVNAKVVRSLKGRCSLMLGDKFVPLSRRRHVRFDKKLVTRCAALPLTSTNSIGLSRLRWLETDTVNLSCGGTMLRLPSNLSKETYLLINLQGQHLGYPNLMIGQVRHCNSTDNFNYLVGVQFITYEEKEAHFPSITLKRLPAAAFEFDQNKMRLIDRNLKENVSHNTQE